MKFTASTLDELKLELEVAFEQAPQQPSPLFACTTALMPNPALFINCVLRNTTLNILGVSDGVHWIRQDTGAII